MLSQWSDKGYRTLVENIPGAVYRCETDYPWRVEHISDSIIDLTGHSAAEFMIGAVMIGELILPDDLDQVRGTITEAISRDEPFVLEYRLRHTDGRPRWVHERGRAICDDDGHPLWLDGVIMDITDRKRAEDALRESEERYRVFFSNSRDAFMTLAPPSWRFTSANPAIVRMFGATDEADLTARGPGEVSPQYQPDGRRSDEKAREMIQTALRTGSYFFEWTHKRLDGEEFPATVLLSRLELGGRVLLQATVRDVTILKEAAKRRLDLERQVQHTQKLESLGVLAGGIAHDFNNLLLAILGNADLALEDMPLQATERGNIEEIKRTSQRAAELVRQMLAYSGKGQFVVEALDLSALVEEMSHILKVSVSKMAALQYDFAPGLPAIEADAAQIRQIVMNLITNASDAIGQGTGEITIRTAAEHVDPKQLTDAHLNESIPEGLFVTLEVVDTGCGMDARTQRNLFDPFFTTKATGRGLGMAAVLGIVRGHKGVIQLHSEVGEGTSIKVLLPAISAAPAAVSPKEIPQRIWRGTGTVLLVDDEEAVRRVAQAMLEHLGLTVIAACDGQEAVDLFARRADEIDCIILDLTMPRMGGEQACCELRRMNPDVPIFISSGYSEQDMTQRFAGSDLAGIIEKPYELARLAATLRDVLD